MSNILDEVRWIETTKGLRTPKECFLETGLELDSNVFGYTYGAAFRFLMTIVGLLAYEDPTGANRGEFSVSAIESVFARLRPHGFLQSDDPFLQVTQEFVTEGLINEPKTEPSKLYPQRQSSLDPQSVFWNFSPVKAELSEVEATQALVAFYFYGPGTNTSLIQQATKPDNLKLNNFSSALRYELAVEILPIGDNLVKSLLLATPRSFVTDQLPHWASRSETHRMLESLWMFSWSGNTVATRWDAGALKGVCQGGVPTVWKKGLPAISNTIAPKEYHDERGVSDPLYLYKPNKDGELTMKRLSLSSDPYATVAQWHADKLSRDLQEKWSRNIASFDLVNVVFLEHETGGTSNSFVLRFSKVVEGYRDELFPDPETLDLISDLASDFIFVKNRLRGLFSEKGTCSYIANRQQDMENEFWGEAHGLLEQIIQAPIAQAQLEKELTKIAVRAFERVSSPRNTIHIEAHIKALSIINGIFRSTK